MKTTKIATVTIPESYTLTVIMTSEHPNQFRVYAQWYEPAKWDMSDPDGNYKMIAPPHNRKKLLEKYADYASAIHYIYQHVSAHNEE